MGTAIALNQVFRLGALHVSAGFSALTAAALRGVPPRLVPGKTWVPRFIAGTPPRPVEPTEPAARFVLAYLAAFLREDSEGAGTLWRDFAYRPDDTPAAEVLEARASVSMAFVLMLQLAARGATVAASHQRPANAHPGARRATRRPHHRDQRRR